MLWWAQGSLDREVCANRSDVCFSCLQSLGQTDFEKMGCDGGWTKWIYRVNDIWGFPKIGVGPPNHPLKNRVFPYKPSILGGNPPIFGNIHICAGLVIPPVEGLSHFCKNSWLGCVMRRIGLNSMRSSYLLHHSYIYIYSYTIYTTIRIMYCIFVHWNHSYHLCHIISSHS